MATKASGVHYNLQPLRRRSHQVAFSRTSSAFSQPGSKNNNLSPVSDPEGHSTSGEDREFETAVSDEEETQSDSSTYSSSNDTAGMPTKIKTIPLPLADGHLDPDDVDNSSECSAHQGFWKNVNYWVFIPLLHPIGRWATGEDHVKNFFLLSFLLYYLHQIVEVPWRLYLQSRSPKRLSSCSPDHDSKDPRQQLRDIAASELRLFELCFLSIAISTPILGALLLRYATALILGADSVSWFSSTLFVLATCRRPWSHLVDRLQERTKDLQTIAQSAPSSPTSSENMQIRVSAMEQRIAYLELSLSKMKNRVKDATEDMYDYVENVIETVDRGMAKQTKRTEKQEARVRDVEQFVEGLKGMKGKDRLLPRPPSSSIEMKDVNGSFLFSLFPSKWLEPQRKRIANPPPPPSSSSASMRSYMSSASSTTRLESIPEEEPPQALQRTHHVLPLPLLPMSVVWSGVGYMVTLPVRVALRFALQR